MAPNSLYPPVAWNADDKRLVKEIFTILEENSSIRKGIWPRKGENSGGKSKISHFKALAKKLFQNEPQIRDVLKEEKAVTHYGITVKNQVARLEKGWKKAKETLGVTGAGLPHKDDIHDGSSIMDKWHEICVLCPWIYQMKILVDNRFNDIGAAITNSGKDIDLDIMNTNRKTSKPSAPLLPLQLSSNTGNKDNNQQEDENNEDEVEWDKTDDEDRNPHFNSGTNFHNTPQPTELRSATPYFTGTVTPNVGFAISRCRPGVLGDLTNGLKDLGVAKNKRKELYDAAI